MIANHEEQLSMKLLNYLNSKPHVQIIGNKLSDRNIRVPTISFIVAGKNSREITLHTDKKEIGIRFGDFYARRLIQDLGLEEAEGVVRVSMVHYNTMEEVERLIDALEDIL